MEFTLLGAALTGVGFAWIGTRIWPWGLPERPTDRMLGAVAVGLLAGRIVAMLIQGTSPVANPGDILVVRGGVHTTAATLVAVAVYAWSVRERPSHLDAMSAPALLGLAGWHAGCLWRGACLGTVSDLPWAWAGPESVITRHPVEIYTLLLLLLFGAVVVSRMPRRPLLRAGSSLTMAAFVRLITEPVRLSVTGGPIGWYLAGIVVGLAVAALGARVIEGPAVATT